MANVLEKKKEMRHQQELKKINAHPVTKVSLETKMHYINGLAFLAGSDENVNETEKEYLKEFMDILKIDDAEFEAFLKTAKEQDVEIFEEFISAISKEEKLKLNFMVDALLIANSDGNICEKENKFIEYLYENLQINEEQTKVINYVFEIIRDKDKDFLISFYAAFKEKHFEQFEYLFIHNHLVVPEIIEEIYHFEWTEWELNNASLYGGRFVATKPVTFQQYLIYLNYLVITAEIKQPDYEWENATDTYEYSDNRVITHKAKEDLVDKFKGKRAVDFAEWLSDDILKDFMVKVVKVNLEGENKFRPARFFEIKGRKSKSQSSEIILYKHGNDSGYFFYSVKEDRSRCSQRRNIELRSEERIEYNWISSAFRLMKLDKDKTGEE